jgi:hypothetical protein
VFQLCLSEMRSLDVTSTVVYHEETLIQCVVWGTGTPKNRDDIRGERFENVMVCVI